MNLYELVSFLADLSLPKYCSAMIKEFVPVVKPPAMAA